MKCQFALAFLTIPLWSSVAAAQAAPSQLSPAQQKIEWAKKAIAKYPDKYQPYNDLALALARRARETSDIAYYAQADQALEQSFRIAPENFEGRKAKVWILLGKHEFAKAIDEAEPLNRQMPDDILVYGYLVDANVELGNYDAAEKAGQWMLDIRPGNIPGLTRGAYLRELFGDVDGAVELMEQAYQETAPNELEDRAWILTQVAHLQLAIGRIESAEKLLDQALILFPGYHYALGNLAQVKTAQQKYSEAVELLRQRYQRAPHAENAYDLAEALERAGRFQEAQAAYAEFDQKARREIGIADNANRELIYYYLDHKRDPGEALRIARQEIERRHDVFTLDAYAWALHANHMDAQARQQIEKALAVGIRDSRIFYHAGAITSELNDRAAAERYLKQSLDLNSLSDCSGAARQVLASLTPPAQESSASH